MQTLNSHSLCICAVTSSNAVKAMTKWVRARVCTCNTAHVRASTGHRNTAAHVTHHTSHVTRYTSHVTRHTSHVTRHRYTLYPCYFPPDEFGDIQAPPPLSFPPKLRIPNPNFTSPLNPKPKTQNPKPKPKTQNPKPQTPNPIPQFIYHGSYGGAFRATFHNAKGRNTHEEAHTNGRITVVIKRLDLHAVPSRQYVPVRASHSVFV